MKERTNVSTTKPSSPRIAFFEGFLNATRKGLIDRAMARIADHTEQLEWLRRRHNKFKTKAISLLGYKNALETARRILTLLEDQPAMSNDAFLDRHDLLMTTLENAAERKGAMLGAQGAITWRAIVNAKKRHAKDPMAMAKSADKLFVRSCWDDWQKKPLSYKSKAAFARDMWTCPRSVDGFPLEFKRSDEPPRQGYPQGRRWPLSGQRRAALWVTRALGGAG